MDLSHFLLTTDANNQKQYVDTPVVIATSTSATVTSSIDHGVGSLPDVRVWVRPTLFSGWKQLGMVGINDGSSFTSEGITGEVSADAEKVYVSIRPTSPSSINVSAKVRVYYND